MPQTLLPMNAIMMSTLGIAPTVVQPPHVSQSAITNPRNFLERHRNATVRSCYAPVDAPIDVGADRVYRIRQVRDSGIETIATSTRRGVNQQNNAPQPVSNSNILNSVVPRHLAPSVYREFPRATFEASAGSVACCSCLLDFDEGDIVVTTPCMHRLHEDCGDGWFLSESHTCPQCRASCGITVNEESANAQGVARGSMGVPRIRSLFSSVVNGEVMPQRRGRVGRGLRIPLVGYEDMISPQQSPPVTTATTATPPTNPVDAVAPRRRGRGLVIPLGYDAINSATAAAAAPPTNPVEALLRGGNNPI
jgi:hypothetical protein